ncbi:acyloxyacyl hydrolase [Defluviimonas sp. WL0024]|uniref:Acyloxyacyl hydrolase n=1 Tax=Albidovulum salinarum TaxID=2984153 RepID=A0ABT2X566_9RHOB|nr:acyloxyacyl hydrolase [Defluviimonas sp. WL0024]MCU9849074.1 acyloxyacyl hydrolase [Defluviimonas sp. WL0024]
MARFTTSLLIATLVAAAGTASAESRGSWLISGGMLNDTTALVGSRNHWSVDYLPDGELFWGLQPLYGLGAFGDGGAYLTAGLRKDFHWGRITLTPHTGTALFESGQSGTFIDDETIQFRTGLDISLPLNERLAVSLGYFHMSNAGLNKASADADTFRLGLRIHY